jgi:hypothetical protein
MVWLGRMRTLELVVSQRPQAVELVANDRVALARRGFGARAIGDGHVAAAVPAGRRRELSLPRSRGDARTGNSVTSAPTDRVL